MFDFWLILDFGPMKINNEEEFIFVRADWCGFEVGGDGYGCGRPDRASFRLGAAPFSRDDAILSASFNTNS